MKIVLVIFALIQFNFCIAAVSIKRADLKGTLYCQNKEMNHLIFTEEAYSADRIVVQKKYHKLYLMNKGSILRVYDIAMGPNSADGPKEFEGDKKTPEGIYTVELKNPHSNYYMALKTSYPAARDTTFAALKKKNAGSFIMIHGFPVKPIDGLTPQIVKDVWHAAIPKIDWTAGCMAVTDREIEEIYSLVKEKTIIEICPI
jgi:murein L,D-transpeptidase YafK